MPASYRRISVLKLAALAIAATITVAMSSLPIRSADESLDYRPDAYAIRGATIIVAPGRSIEGGTVVVRKGIIEAVGPAASITVPADAEVIEGKGLVVYAGFLDPYTTLGQTPGVVRSQVGAGRTPKSSDFAFPRTPVDNRNGLTPEFEVATVLELPDALGEERHKLGFTDLVAAPAGSIATGQSAVASLSGLPRRESIVKAPLALHIRLAAPSEPAPPPNPGDPPAVAMRRFRATGAIGYPVALMGVVAHLRQAMLDADHADILAAHYETKGGVRPAFDPALKALHLAKTGALPVWWEANTRDEIHRALDLAEEFGTTAVIVGGREAAKVADRLKAKGTPVVLRIDFPDEPKAPTEAEYRARPESERTEPLRALADRAARWKERAGTAAALAKAGVKFAFASDGITKAETFPAQVRKTIAAGLSRDAALDALTRRAAEIAGVDRRLGTIEVGKMGHLVAMTAPFDDEKAKVRYVLADGLKFDLDKPGATKASRQAANTKASKDDDESDETRRREIRQEEGRAPQGRDPRRPGQAPPRSRRHPQGYEEGRHQRQEGRTEGRQAAREALRRRRHRIRRRPQARDQDGRYRLPQGCRDPHRHEGDHPPGLDPHQGRQDRGRRGLISKAPDTPNVQVIDAAGLVAIPGIIDTHSHMAISGGVNEMSLSVVPEVRVKDVVTGDDETIFRAAAGGTTSARLLHGSANTIGGQDAVIKLKYGQAGRDLILRDGPQGRQVRPRRERHPADRPVPQHPDGRRGRDRTGLRRGPRLQGRMGPSRRRPRPGARPPRPPVATSGSRHSPVSSTARSRFIVTVTAMMKS